MRNPYKYTVQELSYAYSKHESRGKTNTAIRNGVLIKNNSCDRCSISNLIIEAHHHDYSKPLEIRWLCRTCHAIEDTFRLKDFPSGKPKPRSKDPREPRKVTFVATSDGKALSFTIPKIFCKTMNIQKGDKLSVTYSRNTLTIARLNGTL